ncbi:MAG: alpha/beta hydrolase family protein [Blastocatellia bacterium]|nr:alpha/beta hydrolase family protein [Blastocatellia bacterium]
MLKNWIQRWEVHLSTRDRNRRAEPFTWGFDHLTDMDAYLPEPLPFSDWSKVPPLELYDAYTERTLAASDAFFTPQTQPECHLEDDWLSFRSPVPTPYETNNLVFARYFPLPEKKFASERPPVVIALPQWNGDHRSHVAVCQLLNKLGMAAVRLSMPYHDSRKPPHQMRADYMVSPNLGRTIQAVRQAVQDVRVIIDWLETQGYTRFGIVGTSIGSCISFLTYVHDSRIKVGAFNHVSSYFSDVVWTGISTRHVRNGLEGHITRNDLRRCWSVISPHPYVKRLRNDLYHGHKTLLISARYDMTFLPHLSRQLMGEFERQRIPFQAAWLPCGHYTSGEFPFKFYDGYLMGNHLRKYLVANV